MAVWRKLLNIVAFGRPGGSCHGEAAYSSSGHGTRVAIVGSPNVGKSVVFNRLTGAYVTVSNYPGTTVAVARGKARIDGGDMEILDTPGMYSLLPITEEERVARKIIFQEKPGAVLHVVDAKNLERMLNLTLQLIEAGLPVILNLNMMDELEAAGVEINLQGLERELGIPVVATVATTGWGMGELKEKLVEYVRNRECTNPV